MYSDVNSLDVVQEMENQLKKKCPVVSGGRHLTVPHNGAQVLTEQGYSLTTRMVAESTNSPVLGGGGLFQYGSCLSLQWEEDDHWLS